MQMAREARRKEARRIPPEVMAWRWWAEVKDKYAGKLAESAAGYAAASMFPDKAKLAQLMIFDTTGRDGMQHQDAFLTEELGIPASQNKIDIAMMLAGWGVHMIEVGNAVSSPEEKRAIKEVKRRIAGAGLKSRVVSLARMVREDIIAARESDADILHIYHSGSVPHVGVKFGKKPQDIVPDIIQSVRWGREAGFTDIIVSLEDSVRTDPDHLVAVANMIADVGGPGVIMNVPDTVGVADPAYMFGLITYIRERSGVPLQVHCHNDMGRALDNTLAAIYAGVSAFQATIHGIGERTGNVAMEQVLVNLAARHGTELVDMGRIAEISDFVGERSGVTPPENASVVGRNAFHHASGVHGDATFKAEKGGLSQRDGWDGGGPYAAYGPKKVGRKETVGVGGLCGQKNVIHRLASFGVEVPDEAVPAIVAKVKAMAATRRVSDADFILMAYEAVTGGQCQRIHRESTHAETGDEGAKASVRLSVDGRTAGATATGNGPVDAAVQAIDKALGESDVDIAAYESKAIGRGSNAKARVTLGVRKGSDTLESSCVGTDTVLTTIDAFVKGYNALHALEELRI